MAEIGDLICYTCAGQMKKTLGLVLDRRYVTPKVYEDRAPSTFKGGWLLRVQWLKRGDYLPRDAWAIHYQTDDPAFNPVRDADYKWFHDKPWFKVVRN
jgi:hypothetical protein